MSVKKHLLSISSRNMHLAAFVIEDPETVFVAYDPGRMVFEVRSDRAKSEWIADHANSHGRRVDIVLLGLKGMVNEGM